MNIDAKPPWSDYHNPRVLTSEVIVFLICPALLGIGILCLQNLLCDDEAGSWVEGSASELSVRIFKKGAHLESVSS